MGLSGLRVRPRREADLPALLTILARQQAETSYPFSWPPPYPAEQFVVRPLELAAWVAELDGEVVGHVALHAAEDDELGRIAAEPGARRSTVRPPGAARRQVAAKARALGRDSAPPARPVRSTSRRAKGWAR